MSLTPDQLHFFRNGCRWRDFRALFPSKMAAMTAHASAAQTLYQSGTPTHELEWRHLYDDRETTFFAFLSLLSAPLGVHYSRQNEYRFVTTHEFTRNEWKRLMLGRALGSLCYHVCFGLILICGTGVVVGVLYQVLGGSFDFAMTALSTLSLLSAIGLWLAANRSRSLGLPTYLKPIAKDIFDLAKIKAIKPRH